MSPGKSPGRKSDRIYVAGHRGMVGSAIWRILEGRGFTRLKRQKHSELDLTSQAVVQYLGRTIMFPFTFEWVWDAGHLMFFGGMWYTIAILGAAGLTFCLAKTIVDTLQGKGSHHDHH